MALVIKDRVKENTNTTGTGAVTLTGAFSGYQAFSTLGNANTTYYTIASQVANEWEVGIGTYTLVGTSLARDTVLSSSSLSSIATISSISQATTTVTVNTAAAHGITAGQVITVNAIANATALVSGATVTILTVGTTDFTLIGAASNTVGVSFTASGAGTGTGTVTLNAQGTGKTVLTASGSILTYAGTSATYTAVTVATGSAGVLVPFTSGSKDVFVTYPAGRSVYADSTNIVANNAAIAPVTSGGTGLATLTANYIPYGNGTSPLANSANLSYNGTTLRVGSAALLGGITNPIIAGTGSTNGYIENYVYNASSGTSASADMVVYANNSTDTAGWADFGYTSSTYSDAAFSVTGPNEAYLFSSALNASFTGNLVYATSSTGSANVHQWYVGGFNQAKSAYKMQLSATTLTVALPIDAGSNAINCGPVTAASGDIVASSGNISTTAGSITSATTLTATSGNITATAGNIVSRSFTPTAGTAAISPILLTSGTNLTTPAAGAIEYDGENMYGTTDTTSGRSSIGLFNQFQLKGNGSNISSIANFFGTTSNIGLVNNGYYDIEIILYFTKNTAGTVTWTLTNAAAPTIQNIYFEMCAVSGIVAPPGTAGTMMAGQAVNSTATYSFTTGSLTTGVNHYARFRIQLDNGTGTSLKIQANTSAGTITPLAGSIWTARRLNATNNGTYVA
jgi:hypothetical protein